MTVDHLTPLELEATAMVLLRRNPGLSALHMARTGWLHRSAAETLAILRSLERRGLAHSTPLGGHDGIGDFWYLTTAGERVMRGDIDEIDTQQQGAMT